MSLLSVILSNELNEITAAVSLVPFHLFARKSDPKGSAKIKELSKKLKGKFWKTLIAYLLS